MTSRTKNETTGKLGRAGYRSRGRLAALSLARSEVGFEGVIALHGRAPHAVAGLDEAVHAREGRHVARPRARRVEARVPVLKSTLLHYQNTRLF